MDLPMSRPVLFHAPLKVTPSRLHDSSNMTLCRTSAADKC